ncbi:glycosyltransferase family 4 protein [bacterium]|nr:MAG: glycosyltransferase family 4 protein [bacterium]
MKIAIIAHPFFPIAQPFAGGLEMHTHMLANELVARGHEVTLYAKASSMSDASIIPVMNKGYVFRNYKSKLLHNYQEARMNIAVGTAIKLIQFGKFDYIINNSLSYLPYVKLREVPMMTILHTPATMEPVNKIISRNWSAPPHHQYISVSKTNARSWSQFLPRVDVVTNGIKLDEWRTSDSPEHKTAVWASRITKEKGLHVAIEAAEIAGFNLKIAGPIADRNYYNEYIAPHLNSKITYVGHLDHTELASFFSSGAVAISSPLWEEPFGLTTVEALATGTPVAALPNGAMKEIVIDSVGAISNSETPSDLAQAIQVAATKSRKACREYSRNFSIKAMVDGYEVIMNNQLESIKLSDSPLCRTV